MLFPLLASAQDEPPKAGEEPSEIVITARGSKPKPPVFHSAISNASVRVGTTRITQGIRLELTVIQGDAETLTLGLIGDGEVYAVEGDQIKSWAVRREGDARFLDLKVKPKVQFLRPLVKIRSAEFELPATRSLTHLSPGKAVGFNSVVNLTYGAGVEGKTIEAAGFNPLDVKNQFQTSSGGSLKLQLDRTGSMAGPVELTDSELTGKVDPTGKFAEFQFRSTAVVTEADAKLVLLRGNAAASEIGQGFGYRLKLSQEGGAPVYQLLFDQPGSYPVEFDFVASVDQLAAPESQWTALEFTISAGAVVPLNLSGLDAAHEFSDWEHSIVPVSQGNTWGGFVPANGKVRLAWKAARDAGQGKLFFTTTGTIESAVGPGLLRQNHRLDYKILQGELESLDLELDGPGEVLAVEGTHVVGWKVSGDAGARKIELTLSQPIDESAQVEIRTQTALDAFPVRLNPLRITPVGAVRHSGHIRLTNQGSVRLEPAGLAGLTQLSPDQFPGGKIEARQIFVYRFPSAEFDYEVAADRIQPEINVSQVTLYQLAETDRVITADVELDIREAPLREFDFVVPSDYSVVSVSGATVADYVVGTEVTDATRNLKVIFGQDVQGRQLVSIHLEKNEPTAAGDWPLPRLAFPDAKSVRGDLGVVGAPGFRIGVGETNLLVEKPLSYFPKSTPNLQQAFRIRERGWQGTMTVELLEKSVQADVFHLYSLNNQTAFASVILNYFVTGAPVSEWQLSVPEEFGNVVIDGQDVRTWRREGETIFVSLHQPVIGSHTLLVTYEEEMDGDPIQPGRVAPIDVAGERGFIHVVSPVQVETQATPSENLLQLDALELPAEFRLLTSAPPLETFQYTARPFTLDLAASWFEPGETVTQVVEFSDVTSRVSADGELVTDLTYFVKSRGQQALRLELPANMRLWRVAVANQSVSARQDGAATLIPLPAGTDPNVPVEVRLGLAKPAEGSKNPVLQLPKVTAPVLKTVWRISGETGRKLVPVGGTVQPPTPVLLPRGLNWLARNGLGFGFAIGILVLFGVVLSRKRSVLRFLGLASMLAGAMVAAYAVKAALHGNHVASIIELNLPVLTSGEQVDLEVSNTSLAWASFSIPGLVLAAIGIALGVLSLFRSKQKLPFRLIGAMFLAAGILLQRGGAPYFFAVVAVLVFFLIFVPHTWRWIKEFRKSGKERKRKRARTFDPPKEGDSETLSTKLGDEA